MGTVYVTFDDILKALDTSGYFVFYPDLHGQEVVEHLCRLVKAGRIAEHDRPELWPKGTTCYVLKK